MSFVVAHLGSEFSLGQRVAETIKSDKFIAPAKTIL